MADATRTSRDQDDNVANWTDREIFDRIQHDAPEGLAEALRPLAARLADRAGGITDPRSVLLDLGRVVDSIRAAVAVIIADHELDQHPDAESSDVIDYLIAAVGDLDHIGNNI